MRYLLRFGLLCTMAVCLATTVFGDGGTVQLKRQAGPFVITLFSTPEQLTVGKADFSVMLQSATDNSTLLDGNVMLRFRKPSGGNIVEIAAPANHANATNKLLYAATMNIPSPGRWRVSVDVSEKGQDASALGEINVLEEAPPIRSKWALFAVIPALILFFVLNQWLRRKRRAMRPRARP